MSKSVHSKVKHADGELDRHDLLIVHTFLQFVQTIDNILSDQKVG